MKLSHWIYLGLMPPAIFMVIIVLITYSSTKQTKEKSKAMVKIICENGGQEIDRYLTARKKVFKDWTREDIYGMAIEFETLGEMQKHLWSMLKGNQEFCLLLLTDSKGNVLASAVSERFKSAGGRFSEVDVTGFYAEYSRFAVLSKTDLVKQFGFKHTYAFGFKATDTAGNLNGFFLAYADWSGLNEKIKNIHKKLEENKLEETRIALVDENRSRWLSHSNPDLIGTQLESPVKIWLKDAGKKFEENLRMDKNTWFAISFPVQTAAELWEKDSQRRESALKLAALVPKKTIESDIRNITRRSASVAGVGILFVIATGWLIARTVTRRMGQAISELNTASEELKTAAKQQLSNSAEQVTATTELNTNMEEQVTSSRQISQISNRVVSSAEEANTSANDGKDFLETTVEGMETIRKQVENIVNNMLALGEKSKQMTLALDIINELSGQTTILSYNATIEAAGAGEAGRRFSALAEQIMKLANKAVDSTKEIAALIENIQESGNKTVLATEDGMKAVDEGMRRIQETVQHFNRILTSSDDNLTSAKEIEMTISQQTSAIEQAARVIKNIQTAAEDVQSSSEQTLTTAEQMLNMARKLSEM